MSFQLSVAVRNAINDAFETATGVSPHLKYYTGAPPANCAAAASGTMLADLTLPSDFMANSASGVKSKSGTWSGTGAAAGSVGHFRFYDSAGTTCHAQGTVSYSTTAWAATTAYTAGQKVRNGGNVYNCATAGTSAGSGGPTGTGTGITDNTAVWDYVSAVGDMGLDNTSIAVSQAVSVSTFDLTAPNA